jgi:sensor histidine kinase YesM
MAFTYFSVYYLIPNFFFSNKILKYIVLQVFVLVLYTAFSNVISTYYISPVVYNIEGEYHLFNRFLTIILILIFNIVPLAGVKIISKFREEALIRQKYEHEKTTAELKLREAELKLLKSQIQPHFLFNTLNNIYALSLEKSDKTPDLLIRLSDMLSYIIYDCNAEKVSLRKEIQFINSFVELQKVRYSDCEISVKVKGDMNRLQIAPMILHSFIDNAFKHGPDKDSHNPWIKICLTEHSGSLFFSVINSTRDNTLPQKVPGIGIGNVLKRLELIYPESHDLVIKHTSDKYFVLLKLVLQKNE